MTHTVRHTRLRLIAVTALAVALIATAAVAYAAPTTPPGGFKEQLASKQAQVDALNVKLDQLDAEAEIATEQYNQAVVDLGKTTTAATTAQTDLNNTRAALAIQDEILAKRVASMYRDGNLTAFSILLDSKSVGDFINRVKFLQTIGLNDADKVDALRGQKQLMEQQMLALQQAQQRQEELSFQLKAREVEVKNRLAESQRLLDSAQSDVRAIIAEQAAQSQNAQQALLKSALSSADASGVAAVPGTPVETALAYLGIPYLWGGATPAAFDCSGLVLYVFEQHGVTLPHYSGYQFLLGDKIALADIQPNDVVFFGNPVHHVGIYIGGGYFIEAPHSNDVVKISKLAGRGDIAGVRRYQWMQRTAPIKGARTTTNAALGSVN